MDELPAGSLTDAEIAPAKSQYRELLKKKKAKTNKTERLRRRSFRRKKTSRKTNSLTGRNPSKKEPD